MAINITNKIMGACIVLMMEQYKIRKGFMLEGILFTREEIITWANELFQMRQQVKHNVHPQMLTKYGLVACSEECLKNYYQLQYADINSELLSSTLEDNNVDKILKENLPNDFESVKEFIGKYFEFSQSIHFPPQQKYLPEQGQKWSDVPRRLIWITTAIFTYNEYHRTNDTNVWNYGFRPNDIANFASFLSANPTNSGYSTNVNQCTKDSNNPKYPFLIKVKGKRRIAQLGEVDEIRPDKMSLDYKVNSITGEITVKTLIDFIDTVYARFTSEMPELIEDTQLHENIYDFLQEVYMDEDNYEKMLSLLSRKKNIILQGAPGTGKTFCAKRLAYTFMGEKAEERVYSVQFHQGYSYESFVRGYFPAKKGYELKDGVFLEFCQKANADRGHDYFFIIDEMNRGNISKIFGELFTLLESDKRDIEKITLAYRKDGDCPFSIPENVYIIGLMNTADRSLAMIDYALRRRFGFFTMKPGFDTNGFQEYKDGFSCSQFDNLIEQIKELNKEIAKDDSLGEGFCIGHSFFCELDADNTEEETKADLESIVENEIIPLLEEYWYDDREQLEKWCGNLRGAVR